MAYKCHHYDAVVHSCLWCGDIFNYASGDHVFFFYVSILFLIMVVYMAISYVSIDLVLLLMLSILISASHVL